MFLIIIINLSSFNFKKLTGNIDLRRMIFLFDIHSYLLHVLRMHTKAEADWAVNQTSRRFSIIPAWIRQTKRCILFWLLRPCSTNTAFPVGYIVHNACKIAFMRNKQKTYPMKWRNYESAISKSDILFPSLKIDTSSFLLLSCSSGTHGVKTSKAKLN